MYVWQTKLDDWMPSLRGRQIRARLHAHSVRGFKSRNLIGPFPDVYSELSAHSILSGVKGNEKNTKTNGGFSRNGERALLSRLEVQREAQGGHQRQANLDYNGLACVCRARISEERSSGSRFSVWRPSHTPALTAIFAGL